MVHTLSRLLAKELSYNDTISQYNQTTLFFRTRNASQHSDKVTL